MATVLLVCVVILVIAALVFGIVSLLTGEDPGLAPVEPDGRALPLPNHRSLTESDLKAVRFDLTLRGYRMAQVDRALRRTAYDVGYKDEMIAVLEAEVAALREGRLEDADLLRKAREAAANPEPAGVVTVGDETAGSADDDAGLRPAADDADADDDAEADAEAEAEVDRGDPVPVIGTTPTVGDVPKVGAGPVAVGGAPVTDEPTGEPAAAEAVADSAGEPAVAEAVADSAGEPAVAESADGEPKAAESSDSTAEPTAVESVDGAADGADDEPGRADAAEVVGPNPRSVDAPALPAPAARSAPARPAKRAARA